MKWFREGASPYHTALAMVGAKAAQRVVIIGSGSGPVAAELARVAGLNGRVLVVDRDPATEAVVEAAAMKAGALVEFERASSSMLPLDAEAFDIVVLHGELSARSPEDGRLAVGEAHRVLRPGGRIIVIERSSRPGLFGLFKVGPARGPRLRPAAAIDLLKAAGFLAVRLLAESEGASYVEGRK
jgi:ubiquinone/menaquinone biosynthesis C-methylase UbiE